MGRIVAVTRLKDEIDLVEAFVRHAAAFVDHHILIDNGSIDGTLDVLRQLHGEGLGLTVFRNPVPVASAWHFLQILWALARELQEASWVVPLDCDEFLRLSPDTPTLGAVLDAVPAEQPGIAVRAYNYTPRAGDDPREANPVLRITHRWDPMPPAHKVIVRATADWFPRIVLSAGFHAISLDGVHYPLPETPHVTQAHFYRRTVAQESLKAVIGTLRTMSSPIENYIEQVSTHYKPMYEKVKGNPLLYLNGPSADPSRSVTRDPLDYRGGALRYTPPVDGADHFIKILIAHAEMQASLISGLLRRHDPEEQELTGMMLALERVV
jgi:hypothetical protein